MLNVNQITSDMARLPDAALQRYAMMHKDDPYIVSLALSESNRRKEMRSGAHMQAPQQPSVADQAVAGMAQQPQPQMQLPENVGIGQLPAQNIARMADGGIAGYADGGNMYGYNPATGPAGRLAYENEPVLRMADGGMVAFAGKDGSLVEDEEYGFDPVTGAFGPMGRVDKRTFGEKLSDAFGWRKGEQIDPRAVIAAQKAAEAKAAEMASAYRKPTGVATVMPPTDISAALAPYEQKTTTPPPAPNLQQAAPGAGIPGLMTSPAAAQAQLAKMQAGIKPQVPEAIGIGIAGLQQAQEAAANKNLEAIRQEQTARPLAFKDFETRLKAREERLSAQERENAPLALLQAGLSIMGGTSPFAMANIGAGAQVGVKAYTAGADKLQAARDKLDESFGKIEEVRRNESRMDAKELREAQMAAMQPAIEAKKLTVSALEKDWGLQHQDAVKAWETTQQNARTQYEQAGANARANALPGELRAAMLLGTGATESDRMRSGIPALMELKDHITDAKIAELYTKHVADAKKDGSTPMSPTDFARTLKSAVGAYRPPAAIDTGKPDRS